MPIAVSPVADTTAAHVADKWASTSSAASTLPVIDFAGFDGGSGPDAQRIGDAFYAACRDVGFAYITNFGMDLALVDEMFDWSRRFFELPRDVKMKAPHPDHPRAWHHRGYSFIGKSMAVQLPHDADAATVAAFQANRRWPDQKETFDYGREDHPRLPNICLEDADYPGFRDALNRYFEAGRQASIILLRALALGMPEVPPGYFEDFHAWGDNQIRLLHYPPQNTEALRTGEVGRIGEHTDFGSGTILFQDDTGGLEVEDPTRPGTFLQAPAIAGHAVFNIGDFLQRWSNNTLKSTLHRVRCPPGFTGEITPVRYSIPYFFKADPDRVIECLPGTWNDTDRPKLYEPITAREYVDARHNRTGYKKASA